MKHECPRECDKKSPDCGTTLVAIRAILCVGDYLVELPSFPFEVYGGIMRPNENEAPFARLVICFREGGLDDHACIDSIESDGAVFGWPGLEVPEELILYFQVTKSGERKILLSRGFADVDTSVELGKAHVLWAALERKGYFPDIVSDMLIESPSFRRDGMYAKTVYRDR